MADLLRELIATIHAGDGPFRWAQAVRGALASLLRRSIEATAPAARHLIFHINLDEFRFGGLGAFVGPLLARAVLVLAAADTATGLPLAERLRAWARIDETDAHVHARLLAKHLAAHPPHTDGPDTAGPVGATQAVQ